MNVYKKFQLQIPTLSDFVAAPSGGQTKFLKNSLAGDSGMFLGTKTIILFCRHFFYQFLTSSRQLWQVYLHNFIMKLEIDNYVMHRHFVIFYASIWGTICLKGAQKTPNMKI